MDWAINQPLNMWDHIVIGCKMITKQNDKLDRIRSLRWSCQCGRPSGEAGAALRCFSGSSSAPAPRRSPGIALCLDCLSLLSKLHLDQRQVLEVLTSGPGPASSTRSLITNLQICSCCYMSLISTLEVNPGIFAPVMLRVSPTRLTIRPSAAEFQDFNSW